ncbi:unnamed protein product [Urochloa humidicola]
MDSQGDHDDDEFSWDPNGMAPNLGLDFFSQPPCFPLAESSSGGQSGRRLHGASGVEGLDLNSEAVDITDNMSYLDLLRSSPAGLVGDGERGCTRRGGVRTAARGAGSASGRGAGRGTGRAAGRGRGTGRAAAAPTTEPAGSSVHRAAPNCHPASTVTRQFRPPHPPGGRVNTAGAADAAFNGGVQDPTSCIWSQNPYDEEGDDHQEIDASMNSFSSGEDDESVEKSSSSDDDGIKRNVLSQLKRMQQFGAVACMFGMYYESAFMNKTKKVKTGLSGHEWVSTTLSNPTDCHNMFRMSSEFFFRLHDVLVSTYGLKSSTKMSSVESLAMFLWIVGAPQSIRQAENRLERLSETISRKFEEVLESVYKLSGDVVKPRDPHYRTVHPRLQSPRFSPHFDNCIGAMDGTHIPVVVPSSKLLQYVGRHGYPSQNVLAICDFDMRFTFVVAGWPGSAHDMRILNDAINKYGDKFPHPPQGKFYLVDSGFPNHPGYLAPYKGTKYHLPEFRQGPRPRGKKEVFNYLHSSLRNVIERAFGVLKMK